MAMAIRTKPQAVRVKNVAKNQQRRRTKPVRRLMVGLLNAVLFFAALASCFVAPYVIDALVADSVLFSADQKQGE